MAALPVRADWLKLYKELLRAGREFPQYSYKHFARRRVRDYFEHSRTENLSESRLVEMYEYSYKHFARRRVRDYFEHSRTENLSESRLVEMYEEGKKSLLAIRRQALISTLYPYRPLAVENRNK
uniref:Complex 1 LYR protein domain-containing protein n=1 Tax=Meloidogyne incognita TaxID=6306 RepID=A0A914NBV9_MELIC